jgi:hypothetical protein
MAIKTLVAESTIAGAEFEITAINTRHHSSIVGDQFVLLLFAFHPVRTWANKVRGHAAHWASSNDVVAKLTRAAPFTDTVQTEYVQAIQQDAEPIFARILFTDHILEADITLFVLAEDLPVVLVSTVH